MKLLFDIKEKKETIHAEKKAFAKKQKQETKMAKVNATLKETFGKIEKNSSIHFVSKSSWSMHNLMLYCIDQIGKCDVYGATWSISNEAVKEIVRYQERGLISSLNFLLDWRVKVRRPEAYEFLKFNANKIYISNCHAKLVVLKNKDYCISIVGSANFTNNPRIEAGVLTEDTEVGDFHISWLKEEINNSKPFEEA